MLQCLHCSIFAVSFQPPCSSYRGSFLLTMCGYKANLTEATHKDSIHICLRSYKLTSIGFRCHFGHAPCPLGPKGAWQMLDETLSQSFMIVEQVWREYEEEGPMMVDAGPTRRQSTHYFTTRDTFSSVFQCLGVCMIAVWTVQSEYLCTFPSAQT